MIVQGSHFLLFIASLRSSLMLVSASTLAARATTSHDGLTEGKCCVARAVKGSPHLPLRFVRPTWCSSKGLLKGDCCPKSRSWCLERRLNKSCTPSICSQFCSEHSEGLNQAAANESEASSSMLVHFNLHSACDSPTRMPYILLLVLPEFLYSLSLIGDICMRGREVHNLLYTE